MMYTSNVCIIHNGSLILSYNHV